MKMGRKCMQDLSVTDEI